MLARFPRICSKMAKSHLNDNFQRKRRKFSFEIALLIIINTIYKCVLTLYIIIHILYTFRDTLPAVMTGSLR